MRSVNQAATQNFEVIECQRLMWIEECSGSLILLQMMKWVYSVGVAIWIENLSGLGFGVVARKPLCSD